MTTKQTVLLLGNEAIATGAMEAGISFAVGYPGTPSTDILEYLARNMKDADADWVVNEKVALEVAVGVSYTGRRCLCTMKHVGLNVAADPLMTASYLGVRGGLVIVVADDPGAYSSQNEQDTRYFASFAKVPLLDPSDSQEAKDFTVLAFDLSEEFETPVIVRPVTRVSHGLCPVTLGDKKPQKTPSVVKNPSRMIAVPSNVIRCHKALNEKQPKLRDWSAKSGLNRIISDGKSKGIITGGFAYTYVADFKDEFSILKIASYPFDETIIRDFVANKQEVWVVEEGYPFLETIARKFCAHVRGRLSGDIPSEGELGPEAIARHFKKLHDSPALSIPLPVRPPIMCPGCSHREVYKALKKAEPAFVAGDIGCYTLGAAPPLNALDSCLCMGGSIGKALGMSKQGIKRVVAVIGDSTFMHSGITGLVSASYLQADMLVLILDNLATAMTGHQPTPLTGLRANGSMGKAIDLETLCKACGADSVQTINAYEVDKNTEIFKETLNKPGVNVIISRGPCILLKGKEAKAKS